VTSQVFGHIVNYEIDSSLSVFEFEVFTKDSIFRLTGFPWEFSCI